MSIKLMFGNMKIVCYITRDEGRTNVFKAIYIKNDHIGRKTNMITIDLAKGMATALCIITAIGGGSGLVRAVNDAAAQYLKIVTRVVSTQIIKDTAQFDAIV